MELVSLARSTCDITPTVARMGSKRALSVFTSFSEIACWAISKLQIIILVICEHMITREILCIDLDDFLVGP